MNLSIPSRPVWAAVLALLAGGAAAQSPFRVPFFEHEVVQAKLAQTDDAAPSAEVVASWVADLAHTDHSRREAAVGQLVQAGELVLPAVRPLCAHGDPVLALTAQRVFAHVAGVTPEAHDAVMEQLSADAAANGTATDRAAAIVALGEDAIAFALRQLKSANGRDQQVTALTAELRVQQGLKQLVSGRDLKGRFSRPILELGPDAEAPLKRALLDPTATRAARLHALWLHASVTGANRASSLAPLLADADSAVRGLALALALETARARDFDALARAVGFRPSLERDAVASALASRMDTDSLTSAVRRNDPSGALAALVLGKHRSEDAREALVAATESLEPSLDNDATPYAEALVTALAEHPHEDTAGALTELFAKVDMPRVRAATVAALRHRLDDDGAMTCLAAALFDDDPAVRTVAADALGASGKDSARPALAFAAARESDRALKARTVAALRHLGASFPELTGVEVFSSAGKEWLHRQGMDEHEEELPWYRASVEATNVVRSIRTRIHNEFFHFGDEELVAEDNLNTAALKAMRDALEAADKDGDKDADIAAAATGTERLLMQRILTSATEPTDALTALGTIPFQTNPSDLVRLTNAAATGMTKSLGDRFSRVQASNDPDGKLRPGWLPGLVDDADAVSNGFYVEEQDGVQRVGFVLFDSPAYYADVQVGDQLLRIGEDFVADIDAGDLPKRINTEAEFLFLREGWTRPYPKSLTPVKDNSERLVVKAMLPGELGYIRLKQFEPGCSSRLEGAVRDLEKSGAKGLILDLRNNPGGTVIDATNIVDLFLPEGKVICINEYRKGVDDTREETVRSTSKGAERDIPLAVLINKSSASASEMTSGSLQGNERAIVIGQQSFGKGIGQSGSTVSGFSSDTALGRTSSVYLISLTMMRYYLPEGRRNIHNVGVTPDIPVRERNLRGSRFDSLMRAANHKALGKYVDDLLENDKELAVELAIHDDQDPNRYPELEATHAKVERWVSLDDTRQLVRSAIRGRLLPDADPETFAKIQCDIQEDRTLQAAIRELATTTEIDLTTVAEYGSFAR